MSLSVRITNPLPGGARFTTRKSAKRYIDKRRAEWADATRTAIRFHDCGARTKEVERIDIERHRKRLADLGYDGINRPMRYEELMHIPVARPRLLM